MAFIEYQTSRFVPAAGVNILQRSVDAVGGVDAYLTSGQSYVGWHCLPPTLGVVQLRFALRTQTATSTPRFQFCGDGGASGLVFYYATDLDGGSYNGSSLEAPVGQAVWQPTFNVTGNHTEILAGFVTGGDPTAFKLLDAVSTIPAPSGAKRRGWKVGLGTTTASVPQAVQMTDGPWLSSETAGKTFAAYTPLDATVSTVTVPMIATGGNLTVRATSSATISLVSLGGATDNGDGSITVPGATRCYPAWSASNDLTLAMTKASAGQYRVSYSPFYVDTPPPLPTITKIIPTSGPDTGGTLVDIVGTDLTGASIDFGGTAGTGLTVDPSGNLATVTSPAHTAGPYPVTITTPAGTSAAETFTFEAPVVVPAPTITSIAPDHGDNTGGTAVIIAGTDLTDMTTVTVDGASVPFTVLSDGALTIVTPAHADGPVGLVVTTTHGTSGPATFTFEAPCIPAPTGPTIAGIIPGEALPGATIQIVGTNLTDATVTMCGETAAIASNTGNIITMAIPPTCPDGPTTITVTTPNGETTADFTVLPVPEPGECPSLTDWCAPDTPCPDCTPCVVAPARPLIAMWADLAARIRCGWPDDRCPPGAVTVEATQQPPGSDCDAEVQVIPGGPAGADHAGVTTWGGRVVVLRPWAQINEAGQLTDAAQAQRLEAIARSLEDLQIMQQLIVAAACGACEPGGATIDRVERVTSTTTLGWAFAVRIS